MTFLEKKSGCLTKRRNTPAGRSFKGLVLVHCLCTETSYWYDDVRALLEMLSNCSDVIKSDHEIVDFAHAQI